MTSDTDPRKQSTTRMPAVSSGGKHSRIAQPQPNPVGGMRPVGTDFHNSRQMNFGPSKRSNGKIVALVFGIILLIIAALVAAEIGLNAGKVHYGVKVGGVDIGGMERTQAVDTLQSALDSRLSSAGVRVTPSAEVLKRLEESTVDDTSAAVEGEAVAGESAAAGEVTQGSGETSLAWSFTAADLGASVDAATLVDEAMGIGEVTGLGDFFPSVGERFASIFGQIDLSVPVAYDNDVLTTSLSTIDEAIGVDMVNGNIAIDADGHASPTAGRTGEAVDAQAFATKATEVLVGASSSSFDVPMTGIAPDIDEAEAQAVADKVNAATAEPVIFVYNQESWSVWAPKLGEWTKTEVQGTGDTAQLVYTIDSTKAYNGLQQLMGEAGYGSAENAKFDVSSGTPVIVGGTVGTGPDIKTGVHTLNEVLYGTSASGRTITLVSAEVSPEITADAAKKMGVVELITSFKLAYGSGGGSGREYNIERCLDKLNGSLIASGSNWNWNEVVGLCDETTGYEKAPVIVDNEIVQSAGGGICNVATGVYNAAYEAGLPILERSNHSIFQPNYPLGRDAAVSWEYPTLAFANDTKNYILVTATYDGADMEISIWGTNEHRSVGSTNSEWTTTDTGGKSIINYRTVKSADGTVLREDSFYSYFPPEKAKE